MLSSSREVDLPQSTYITEKQNSPLERLSVANGFEILLDEVIEAQMKPRLRRQVEWCSSFNTPCHNEALRPSCGSACMKEVDLDD